LTLDGPTYVTDLAKRLNLPRTGLYRMLRNLEEQGFVHSVKSTAQPTYFYAERLPQALENLAKYQREVVAALIRPPRNQYW